MRFEVLIFPFAATPAVAGLIKAPRNVASTVNCDFEDPALFLGLSGAGVTSDPIYEGYCGFHWDSFNAGARAAVQGINMDGNGFGIGTNNDGSSLMIKYVGSKTNPFDPTSVKVGCYVRDRSGVTLAIRCSLKVSPSNSAGTVFNPPFQTCDFHVTSPADETLIEGLTTLAGSILFNTFGIGIGTVQTCTLPVGWKNVEKLTFALDEALLPDLSGLTAQLGLDVGSPAFVIDDFVYETA